MVRKLLPFYLPAHSVQLMITGDATIVAGIKTPPLFLIAIIVGEKMTNSSFIINLLEKVEQTVRNVKASNLASMGENCHSCKNTRKDKYTVICLKKKKAVTANTICGEWNAKK